MHIRQLKINRFKSFESVEFFFNRDLNVLTGVNNSGKTTVLEAIALWAECFRKRIWQTGKADTKRGLKRGQYRIDYEAYVDINSVRSPNFEDIFFDLERDQEITLEATLEDQGQDLNIGFSIRAARGGNYAVDQLGANQFPFSKFNDFFQKLPTPLNVVYASPVAALLPREEFETLPKIRAQVDSRQSMQVLRNRLYQLKKDSVRFQSFCDSVAHVLTDGQRVVDFSFDGDEAKDVEIRVDVRVGPKDVAKDISLLGSGTVQIIEIMLAIHAEHRDLNIVLLDEPDSHIHRDIQRRLVRKLVEHTDRTQVFLTTHNESLIRSTRPEYLFHLEPRQKKVYHPVYQDKVSGQIKGLQPSRHLKILRTLGSETSIDFLNALEAEHLVLVEGEDDARFIQDIVERATSPSTPFHAMYWAFGGLEPILQRIGTYKEIFEQFRNDKVLWKKAVLVIDRDNLTDQQRSDMLQGLSHHLGIPVYVSTSYTMEATVLSDPGKLKTLLGQLISKQTGVAPDPANVDQLVDAGLKDLAVKLQERVGEQRFLQELFHRMRTRRERLEDLGIRAKNIIHDDARLQPEYTAFANAALSQGRLNLLANKDDVAGLIEGVHQGLSVQFHPDYLFERMIETATPSTWFDEWKELRQSVK